jgi:predicted PurR-regulated permease PerM
MNIKKIFHKKHTVHTKIDPRIFWQWCVIIFCCMFIVIVLMGVVFFRNTQRFIDTTPTVDRKDTDQQVSRIEKRMQYVESVIEKRTGTSIISNTSQN